MKQLTGKYFVPGCLFLTLLFNSGLIRAQGGMPYTNSLDGSLNQIKRNATDSVQEPFFANAAYASTLVKPYTIHNVVSLKLNESSPYFIKSNFSTTVSIRIYFTTEASISDSVDKVLGISYNYGSQGSNYANEYVFSGDYKVVVKIMDTSSNVGWNVWNLLVLYNTITPSPVFTFDCSANAIQTVMSASPGATTASDTLNTSWGNVPNAHVYDLEWTYVDSSAISQTQYNHKYGTDSLHLDPNLIFDNNTSRVTVATTSYNIPLLYDGSGSVFFRVRPVQYQVGGGRSEAHWSSDYLSTGGLGRFDFKGHQRNLNWQATTSFAEEGKRKSVVQYYDGSLRSRQTVTKDNSTFTTIVAESFYDYQGRPVIQVLPAPTLRTAIGYFKNFNTGTNGPGYDKSLFDTLANPAQYCSMGAGPMITDSGASNYYSSKNPLDTVGFHKFIPDAGSYPFTETQYVQDNTGRIAKQGGVGAVFQIGQGHETRYFYGTPDQRQLDALFGTEMGDHNHYFKTMVRDGNGQYSVSYTDMHGRTIATALAGAPPDTMHIQKLPSYSLTRITEALADSTTNVTKDLVMESKRGLLVPVAAMDTFNYSLTPQLLQIQACDNGQVCYDCLYDLEIVISDDCNNQAFGGQPFDTVVHNFTLLSGVDTSCNAAPGFNFSFAKYLPEGSYQVTKRLSVSRYGSDYLRDSIYLKKNTCTTQNTVIANQATLIRNNTAQCVPTCASCTMAIGTFSSFYTQFKTQGGIASGDTTYYNAAQTAYQQALAGCKALCDSAGDFDDIQQQMLLDMTPFSGQYANINNAFDPYSIFYVDSNVVGYQANYTKPTNYVNENGDLDRVYDETAGTFVNPQDLGDSIFSIKFKLSWAQALLPYHPEYLKFVQYQALTTSSQWDRRFEETDSYADAMKKGYLNPLNISRIPYNRYNATVAADPDPLASVTAHDYKTPLDSLISNYTNTTIINTIGFPTFSTPVSMWAFATAQVRCALKDSTCFSNYTSTDSAFNGNMCTGDLDMAWRAFRQMYLDVKHILINRQINSVVPVPTATTLIAAGHQPHFSDALELYGVPMPNSFPNNISTAYASKKQGQDSLTAYYGSTCQAYVSLWMQQLAPCGFAVADSVVFNELVKVCQDGSDAKHPLGASSVAPTSKYQFRSFEDVINAYKITTGMNYPVTCNAYAITAPRPYDQQTVYSAKPVWLAPDSCECSQIAKIFQAYQTVKANYTSFSVYMLQVENTTISDSLLTVLLNSCSLLSGSCVYFTKPVSLPPAFQCGSGDVCAPCATIQSLTSEFSGKYPGMTPVKDISHADSNQLSINHIYEQFMNYRLGYTKRSWDYLDFLSKCSGNSAGKADSLQNLVTGFTGGDATNYAPAYDFNSEEGEQISDFHRLCYNGVLHLPDSIRTKYSSWYNNVEFRTNSTMCWDSGYTVEMRVKMLTDFQNPWPVQGDVGDFITGDVGTLINRFTTPTYVGSTLCSPGIYFIKWKDQNTLVETYTITRMDADTNGMTNWTLLKIKFTPTSYQFYYNNTLISTLTRTRGALINRNYTILTNLLRQLGVDWVKYYDGTGVVRYFEDFNNPDAPAVVDRGFYCPGVGTTCQQDFVSYFNYHQGTSYTYNQIDSIYMKVLNIHPNVCGINPQITTTDTCSKFSFQKTYGGSGTNELHDVHQTFDGGYISGGSTSSSGHGAKDGYLVRTDKKGNVLWAKAYGGAADDYFYKVKQTSDSGFIAIGATKSFHQSQGEIFVTRVNANGDVIWSRGLAKATTNGEVGYDIIQNAADSGFSLVGIYNNGSGVSDWEVDRLDKNGTVLWGKQFGNSSSDVLGSILEDADTLVVGGGTVVSGYSYYKGVIFKVLRTTGALVWTKTYQLETESNWGLSLAKTTKGYRANLLNSPDFTLSNAVNLVMDVDKNGKMRWVKELPKPSFITNINWGTGFTTSDAGYVFAQGDVSATGDILLHKLDSNGAIVWSNRIVRSGTQFITQILQNADGSFAGAGYDGLNALLLKTDKVGKTGCNDSAYTLSTINITDSISAFITLTTNNSLTFTSPAITQSALNAYSLTTVACLKDSCASATSSLYLCGRSTPVFGPAMPDTISSCLDSTFFAVSLGKEIYKSYTDSITNRFDSAYRGKCLNAFKYEKFTVTHSNTEFHYTLYYYDQAGNLLKTVAPAGVHAVYDSLWLDSVATARKLGNVKLPAHTLITQYRYNTLNQVISQKTPDAGKANFWYDRLGRLSISENARQRSFSASETGRGYSYTIYDYLGRITEVGQIRNATTNAMTDSISRKQSLLDSWITSSVANKEQITTTVYDVLYGGYSGFNPPPVGQRNLRNRVSYTSYTTGNNVANFDNANLFTYDIEGNVDTLLLDFGSKQMTAQQNLMNMNNNRFKTFVYEYDLISGKVNKVTFQPHKLDQYIHHYVYDAENRLISAETSSDSVNWENQVAYQYYKHGPLARMVLGGTQVQGLDFAYTLQGWLKGVNSTSLRPGLDMGRDGDTSGINKFAAKDVFSYNLNYYVNDYAAINTAYTPFPGTRAYLDTNYRPLYNGNIGSLVMNLGPLYQSDTVSRWLKPLLYNYRYDQLNRLVQMDPWYGLNQLTNSWSAVQVMKDYRERMSYDPSGNMLGHRRNSYAFAAGNDNAMDSLNYTYNAGTNQLNYIKDSVNSGGSYDLQTQPKNNYGYDSIGNLIKDSLEGIPNNGIDWNVYGKILRVNNSLSTNPNAQVRYTYNAAGNRVSERVVVKGSKIVQWRWYVRDAQGNIMATYVSSQDSTQSLTNGGLTIEDHYLYGSSRLATLRRNFSVINADSLGYYAPWNGTFQYGGRGNISFELSNHLGSVMAVISDRKLGIPVVGDSTHIGSYTYQLRQAMDYLSFGDQMQGRFVNSGYRYGFNGKQDDDNVKGNYKQIDYGARVYDPRVARFLSLDPIQLKYPELTPYQFASNRPIDGIDLNGFEWRPPMMTDPKTGQMVVDNKAAVAIHTDKKNLITVAIVLDIVLTKGILSRVLLASEVIGAFPHNKSSTAEGRKQQNKESQDALTDAGMSILTGRVLGQFARTLQELKSPIVPFTTDIITDNEIGLFRADTRQADGIFKTGFSAKGTSTDIVEYVEANSPSVFIGTSKSATAAAAKVKNGFLFVIDNNGKGFDVNNYYKSVEGTVNPYSSESEVIFSNKIPASQIKGAYPIINGKVDTKNFIKNTQYKSNP